MDKEWIQKLMEMSTELSMHAVIKLLTVIVNKCNNFDEFKQCVIATNINFNEELIKKDEN